MLPLKHRHQDLTPNSRPATRARYAEDSWANLNMPLPYGNPMARRRFSTRRSEVDVTTVTAATAASDRSDILEEAQASVTRYYAQAKELDDQLATVRQERNGLLAKIQELQATHEKQLDTLIVKIDEQQTLIKRYQSLGDVDELEHLQDDESKHVQQLREYKDRVLRLEEELSKAKELAQDDRDDALAYENLLAERNNQIDTLQADIEQQARKIAQLEKNDHDDVVTYKNLLVERNNKINTLQTDNEQQARKIAQLEQRVHDTEQQAQAEKSNETMQLREYKDRMLHLEEELSKAKKLAQDDHDEAVAYENLLVERNNQIDALQADSEQQSRTIARLEQRLRDAEQQVQAEKSNRDDAVAYKNLLAERNNKINTLQTDNEQLSRKIAQLEQRVRDTEQQVQAEKSNETMQAQQLREYKERVLHLEEDLAKSKELAQNDREDMLAYENLLAERSNQIDALQADIEQQTRKIAQLEKSDRDDTLSYKNLLAERNSQIDALQADNEQLSRKIVRLEQRVRDAEEQAQEEKKTLEDRLAEFTKAYNDTAKETEDVKEKLKRVAAEKDKIAEAYEEAVKEAEELKEEFQRVMAEKKKIANELDRANSTLKHAQKKDDIINTLYAARSNLSRELSETASHLNQMADDAARREEQLASMEEARRKELSAAKQHERQLTDRIDELEQTIANYERQLSNFGKLEKQFQDQNVYIEELQDALHQREARLKEVQHAVDVSRTDLEHSKEALDKALLHVERLEHELNALNDERRKKTEQIARLHSAVAEAEAEQKSLEGELVKRQQEFKRLIAEREDVADQAEQAEKSLAEAHRTVENLEKHLQEANAAARVQEEERVVRIGQLERSVERILEDLELTRKQLGDAERVRTALQEEVRRLRIQVKEHEDQDEDRTRLLARSQRKLAALQEENKNWLLQLQQAETEAGRLRLVLGELTKYGEEALAQ